MLGKEKSAGSCTPTEPSPDVNHVSIPCKKCLPKLLVN